MIECTSEDFTLMF